MPNQSTEDYLKGIYKLQKNGKAVATSELARHLHIGDGSVTGMVKKLSARKLLRYTPYKGVSLTAAGRRVALQMIRRHRLWEMFLVRYLGYAWDEIHGEADRLEHAASEETIHRLDRMLGFPKADPHGDPIPDRHGEVADLREAPLTECNPGDTVRIVRVDDIHEVLKHAAKLGLSINRLISVREKLSFDGSMVLKVGRREEFISHRIASSVFVRLP